MNTLYRSVDELPEAAIELLKMSLYYDDDPDSEYMECYSDCLNIPDEAVYEHFAGICFVPEDFVPGAGDDWGKVK